MKRGLTILILLCAAALAAAAKNNPIIPCQFYFNVVTQDRLKNVSKGLSAENAEWFQKKILAKYPGACYAPPAQAAPIVFFITVTPDTFHGTRIVNNTSTESNPVSGTITDEDGNTSHVSGTVETTTTSSTAVPYSFEYGIFTLTVERRRSDGQFDVLQTFQQKGIYNPLYGIPLGGRGHHPFRAVIEDAVKWVNAGGVTGESQPFRKQNYMTTLQKAAERGDAKAQSYLGDLYYNGLGVSQDFAQAAMWSRKAAEQGDATAQFNLGLLYANGEGVAKDYAQAAVWWRKAAEQGDAHAQYSLGLSYATGNGVAMDYAQAAVWIRKAAEQGYADAQLNLGLKYFAGLGVPQDYAQAAVWYRKAAEQGDAEAQFNLGVRYYAGQGVPQDYAQAYFWFNIAATGNLVASQQEDNTKFRDLAASHLMPADLSQVQGRAREWFELHQSKSK